MPRIVLVSDSHLSPAAPHADEQWGSVVDEVGRLQPSAVVHAGDITLHGDDDPDDLAHGRRLLDALPAPWFAIPGNHDIGDLGETSRPVDDRRRAAYGTAFGTSHWAVPLDGWQLVGIDIQTMAAEPSDDAWGWLDDALTTGGPTALFLHRPLLTHADDEADDPRRYVPEPVRQRLFDVMTSADVRLVASGHVHQWRVAHHDGRVHVWAPSTWASLPDSIQPTIGTKVTGIVAIDLDDEVSAQLVQPAGLRDLTIGDDFTSPYTS